MGLKYKLNRMRENLLIKVAWAMPKSIVMWCSIRLMAHATVGQYENQCVPELTCMDALKRWETAAK